MTRVGMSLLYWTASAIMLAACSTKPITVSSTSTALFPSSSGQATVAPQSVTSGSRSAIPISDGSRCAVYLADTRDVRLDPNDLGMMGLRDVRTTDSVAWLKAALSTLKQDSRLSFVDDAKDAGFTLRIELVKAYVMTMTTQKSANVVLRASYSRDGKELDSQIARGRDTGANWVNGEDEAQGSLNRALSAAVLELDSDIVARCRSFAAER